MAAKSRAASGSTAANIVTTVQITNHGGTVEVTNRSGTGELWVRFDGVDPVIEGDDSYCVLTSKVFTLDRVLVTAAAEVRLLSAAVAKYTVAGGPWFGVDA